MSGPKGGNFYLKQEVARRLEAKRRARLAEKVCAVEQFNKALNDVRCLRADLEQRLDRVLPPVADNVLFEGIAEKLKGIRKYYDTSLERLAGVELPKETKEIRKKTEELSVHLKRIKEKAHNEIDAVNKNIHEAWDTIEKDKVQNQLAAKLETYEKKEKTVLKDYAFNSADEIRAKTLHKITINAEDCIKRIEGYMEFQNLSPSVRTEASRVIELYARGIDLNLQCLKEKIAHTETRYQNLLYIEQRIKKEISAFERAYAEYLVECSTQGLTPKSAESFSGIDDLNKELQKLKDAALKKETQIYIKDQIADIMHGLGYNIINSEILESRRDIGQDYYQFDDDSAIRVSLSRGNTMMIEVVGLGDEQPLSETEIEALFTKQVEFCKVHPNILKKLRERGIRLENRVEQKPHRDHAKKITIKNRDKKNKVVRRGDKKAIERRMGI